MIELKKKIKWNRRISDLSTCMEQSEFYPPTLCMPCSSKRLVNTSNHRIHRSILKWQRANLQAELSKQTLYVNLFL